MDAEPPTDYVLPNVYFQSPSLRLRIISSYWLVFLWGLPLWWLTTSIQRLALPVERVRSSTSASELRFSLDILIESTPGDTLPPHTSISELAREVGILIEQEKRDDPVAWQGIDVNVEAVAKSKAREPTYRVALHSASLPSSGEQPPLWLINRSLHVRVDSFEHDPLALRSTLASSLSGLLAVRSGVHRGRTSQEHLVVRYAPKYRLAFSLLNEDASAGGAVHSWDVEAGIDRYLSAVLSQLSILHNFTIESQVQFHAPLAFDPPEFHSPREGRVEARSYLLGEEELKMFINSADWTLASSVSEDPVLHFILFVPSALRRPLKLQTPTGGNSNAFIVPQWGGVVVLDPSTFYPEHEPPAQNAIHLSTADLGSSFQTFRSQLLTLLGLPPLPPSISVGSPSSSATKFHQLSEWQLDALLRRRTLENIRDSKEALASIIKLVAQIENMPVGQDVKGDVQGALDAIEQVYSPSASGSPQLTLQYSARANTLSSRAFFNPGMLALLYFPAEHKYAVYIPLFAPVSVPLVAVAFKEFRRWRKERAERARNRQKVD